MEVEMKKTMLQTEKDSCPLPPLPGCESGRLYLYFRTDSRGFEDPAGRFRGFCRSDEIRPRQLEGNRGGGGSLSRPGRKNNRFSDRYVPLRGDEPDLPGIFSRRTPARTCIGVKELPRRSQIEIEVIALGSDQARSMRSLTNAFHPGLEVIEVLAHPADQ